LREEHVEEKVLFIILMLVLGRQSLLPSSRLPAFAEKKRTN